jgi:hypothetical protein
MRTSIKATLIIFQFSVLKINRVYCHISTIVIRCVRKTAKSDYQLRRVSTSVRLSAWNNSTPNGRIFIKLDLRIFR